MVWQISRWWLFRAIPVLKFNEQRLGPSTLPHLTLYLFHDCIVRVGGCGCIPHHLLPELGVGSFTSPLGLPISLARKACGERTSPRLQLCRQSVRCQGRRKLIAVVQSCVCVSRQMRSCSPQRLRWLFPCFFFLELHYLHLERYAKSFFRWLGKGIGLWEKALI